MLLISYSFSQASYHNSCSKDLIIYFIVSKADMTLAQKLQMGGSGLFKINKTKKIKHNIVRYLCRMGQAMLVSFSLTTLGDQQKIEKCAH